MNDRLLDYENDVKLLAENKSDAYFQNDFPEHTSIVISNILNYSCESVYIYDNDLRGDIVFLNNRKLINSLKSHIEARKKLHVVLRSRDNVNNELEEFVREGIEKFPENFKVKFATEEFQQNIRNVFGQNINFTVGDDEKFRVEKFNDDSKRDAFCCFNDKKFSSLLKTTFENKFEKCQNFF